MSIILGANARVICTELYYTVLYVLEDLAYAFVIVLLVAAAFSQRHIRLATKAP
jgi:hypothetical protein